MSKVFQWLARLLSALALLAMGLWFVGRLASDRTLATQYISWVPTWMLVGLGAAALLAWFLVALLHQWAVRRRSLFGDDDQKRPLPGVLPARAAMVGLVASVIWLAAIDLRLQNRFIHRPMSVGLNVTAWNAHGVRGDEIVGKLLRTDPDVVILSNSVTPAGLPDLLASIREKTLEPTLLRVERFVVASRYPVKRWAYTELGVTPASSRWIDAPGRQSDPGRALYLEIDAFPAMPKPLVVWALDLPSDPNLARWSVAKESIRRLERFTGMSHVRQASGEYIDEPMAGGFKLPDLIVGDLNIPRGSASLTILAEGMANAFDQAGHGLVATYPRERPLLHLDQMFVGHRHRANKYSVLFGDSGTHAMQWARIVARAPGGGVPSAEPPATTTAPAPSDPAPGVPTPAK